MAAAPRSPGYYPAPDGNGEQWWNGVGWSEARRGHQAVAAAPIPAQSPLTGTRNATPTPPGPAPYAPSAQPRSAPRSRSRGSGNLFVLFLAVFGFVWWPVAVGAVIIAFFTLIGAAVSRSGARVVIAVIALGVGGFALFVHLAEVVAFVQNHLN